MSNILIRGKEWSTLLELLSIINDNLAILAKQLQRRQLNGNFHQRRSRGILNSGPSDSKLDALMTQPRFHISLYFENIKQIFLTRSISI